jgi:metallo-beta-lactamase family protein
MHISFYGAADGVTGSRHLVEIQGLRLLLDCGMFQGYKLWRERNWQPFPVPPGSIDAVLLSHAHLDHSGWLPCLVKQGFKGPIYCSAATRDLAELLLLDAAHLQEEDARRANRGGWSRHEPALPLFTTRDAQRAIAQLSPVAPNRPLKLGKAVQASFVPAGHLLGACCIHLHDAEESLLYSGDLGRDDDLLMPPPSAVPAANTVLVESTYGNRLHPSEDMQQRLGEIIRRTVKRGGKVLLPTFAVGRAQGLMLVLQRLRAAGEIPADMPIYLDSPMAQGATEIYLKHRKLLRLSAAEARTLCDGVTAVTIPKESEKLVAQRWPAVVLSASGMATGGRVLHHLSALAPHPKNAIVFPGFQVAGSRGAKLVGGAADVKIFGRYVAVKAEVHHLEGFSGHADRAGLLAWLKGLPKAPRHTYLVHGDPDAADTLRTHIADTLGWTAQVPGHGSTVEV